MCKELDAQFEFYDIFVIQNVDLLYGRYKKEWTEIFHLHYRACVNRNIVMY